MEPLLKMGARMRPNQPIYENALFHEIERLYFIGWSILPLGTGIDGKSPSMAFADRKRLPLEVIKRRLIETNSDMYGIRCDGIVVVDCDTSNVETITLVEKRFGKSFYQVKTPRGIHFYYRVGKHKPPPSIRQSGISIDFKTGNNAYVVAPYSERPDGGIYQMIRTPLGPISDLPVFKDNYVSTDQSSPSSPVQIRVGTRTNILWKWARELVETVDSEAELFKELRAHADYQFEDAQNFHDREIKKCVKWTWNKRLENSLWGGKHSAVTITSKEANTLLPLKNGSDALVLLWLLKHNFDRTPPKPFPVAGAGMARSGILPNWSKSRIYRARSVLLKCGFLKCVRVRKKIGSTWSAELFMFSHGQR